MFTPKQNAALAAPLSTSSVKERKQAGRKLSYIEGWHAIAEANRIFGFDGWASETLDIRVVSEAARKIGQDKRDGWGVSYVARVRVTVDSLTREGVGAGHGIDVDLGLAHESAIKEAETDARKRALMTFGNPFGLALYDKEQRNVADDPPPAREPDPAKTRYLKQCWDRIHSTQETEATLREWWRAESGARRAHDLDQDDVDRLKSQLTERLDAFQARAAA